MREAGNDPADRAAWPATLAPVRQLLDEGLELSAATVIVGDNGVGKSTLVEAIAVAFGLSPEGGSTWARHSTRTTESSLSDHLWLARDAGALRLGYFLRAETMHGFYTYLEEHPGARPEPRFHEMSHGESFLEIANDRFRPGLIVLDEPESALSFTGCLSLLGVLGDLLLDPHTQVILSTHSPILAALPGADILEFGDWGIRRSSWDELGLVQHWRRFLDGPDRYLRHLSRP